MKVFHLKYRPQRIDELDLKDVANSLKKILLSGDMPQSFLFCGPKGSGKTSAARILAKNINCLKKKNGLCCLKCDNCVSLTEKKSIDLIEIDGASNRGIDDVRWLKDQAYLSPAKLKKKVFIIDEVHMLTRDAFNALLKLLEEPPEQVVFVLCTTDPQKLPETVLSRLFRIDFRKGDGDEILSSLNRVIKAEKLKVSKQVLKEIVLASEGSFRNAQKMLMELFLEFGKQIKGEKAKSFLERKRGGYDFDELAKDLEELNKSKILNSLEKMAQTGVDLRTYRWGLIDYFQKKLLDVGKSGVFSGLSRWLRLLIEAGNLEKESNLSQLPLQLAVVDYLGDVARKQGGEVVKLEKKEVKKRVPRQGKVSLEEVEKKWTEVLRAVKPFNHSVEAFLRASRPKLVDGDKLVVEVFYSFHKERLEEQRNKTIVEKGLDEILGCNLSLVCVLSDNKRDKMVETKKDMYDVAKDIFG
ncbi:DNA polymerase III subunit gamma/tau [Candidatus Shapirobacteria bacterium]|nr:MAG: DNA polymerase III subunit gamma/tau [Candidatus Shapirobacteria bacterium]